MTDEQAKAWADRNRAGSDEDPADDLPREAIARWILARLEAERWMPVGERLPGGVRQVQIFSLNSGQHIGTLKRNLVGEEWWETDCNTLEEVTHWRPLPPGPR